MADSSARVVLRDRPTRDQLDDARAAHGWHLANIVKATDAAPFQIVFLSRDEADVIHFVDDERGGAAYFTLRGDVDRVASEVRASFAAVAPEEILAPFSRRSDRETLVRALHRASLAAADVDPARLAEAVRAALAHNDAGVRAAALQATRLVGLRALEPAVRKLANTERDATLRAQARAVLDHWGSQ